MAEILVVCIRGQGAGHISRLITGIYTQIYSGGWPFSVSIMADHSAWNEQGARDTEFWHSRAMEKVSVCLLKTSVHYHLYLGKIYEVRQYLSQGIF